MLDIFRNSNYRFYDRDKVRERKNGGEFSDEEKFGDIDIWTDGNGLGLESCRIIQTSPQWPFNFCIFKQDLLLPSTQ